MLISKTEKTVKVYMLGEEIVEVETHEQVIDFWYTREGFGIKKFVFGIGIEESQIEDYLDAAFEQGSEMWEMEGIE